ncbi:MAG: hypothetical protein M1834_001193 [Cirrosporium novae-zelandiae]|nr:MAG: hypothetical protein M1834_001193 [Cirrosporium novae-zelandiae]
MTVIKNVAIAGATGNLGPAVLNELISSRKFNITVLKRASSTGTIPASVKSIVVDYNSLDSLKNALQGQDAVVSTVGTPAFEGQKLIIDAAIAANVKRFIPSEFGSDTKLPSNQKLPVFGGKVQVQRYLEDKARTSSITYTYVVNGAFLDWGLRVGFVLAPAAQKAEIYDGGDQLFSASRLSTVGKAVVGVLEHPDETVNRAVYVNDIATSQNKLLEISKKLTPGKAWQVTQADTAKLTAESDAALAKGDINDGVFYNYIRRAIWGAGHGGHFQKLDNKLLGIPEMTEKEVEDLIASIIAGH